MSEHTTPTVWPAFQAHDPELVIRTLVALGFEETVATATRRASSSTPSSTGPRAAG